MKLQDLYIENGYPGYSKLYSVAKEHGYTSEQVKKFLSKIEVQQLHKRKTQRKKYSKIISLILNDQWQMDLVDMSNYSKFNKGIHYLLTIVDVFSRFAYVLPLKSKTQDEIFNSLQELFKKVTPNIIFSDNGSEFINKKVQKLFQEYKIKHFTFDPGNHNSLGIIERFNQTFKNIIYKHFTAKNTNKYIDDLNKYVKAYNNRIHDTLGMSPNNASKKPDLTRDIQMQLAKHNQLENIPDDTKVRIPIETNIFGNRSFVQKWSNEIYTTVKSGKLYKVKDNEGNVINKKYRYYELQPIKKVKKLDIVVEKEQPVTKKQIQTEKQIQKEKVQLGNVVGGKYKGEFKRLQPSSEKRSKKVDYKKLAGK